MHPECGCASQAMAFANDRTQILSTEGMVKHARRSLRERFLVATETGILHRLNREVPGKRFEPVREEAVCRFMKMITLEKMRDTLRDLDNEVTVEPGDRRPRARRDRPDARDRLSRGGTAAPGRPCSGTGGAVRAAVRAATFRGLVPGHDPGHFSASPQTAVASWPVRPTPSRRLPVADENAAPSEQAPATQPSAAPAGSAPSDAELLKKLEEALFEIRRIIAGQEAMLERVLVCLLAGGHLLIEGVPGLAKTLTIKSTASVLGGSFKRVQFTPDLVPSDLVGTRVFRPDHADFDTELGPVFCNFLLADEINRAPAKVQSALLEVMQERQVTIGHNTFPVPDPFLVLATQNPIESEGTYPLPEAQVDRFMLKMLVDYPTHDQELTVVLRSLEAPPQLAQVLSLEELRQLQAQVGVGVRRSGAHQLGRRRRDRDAQAGRARPRRRSPRTSRTARARAARSA